MNEQWFPELRLGVEKVKHVGREDLLHSGTYSDSTGFIQENAFRNLNHLGEVRLIIVTGKCCSASDHKYPRPNAILKETQGRGRFSSRKVGVMIFFLFYRHQSALANKAIYILEGLSVIYDHVNCYYY